MVLILTSIGFLIFTSYKFKSEANEYRTKYEQQKTDFQDSLRGLQIDYKIIEKRLEERERKIRVKNAQIHTLKRRHGKKISDIDNISADSSERFIADKYRLESNP